MSGPDLGSIRPGMSLAAIERIVILDAMRRHGDDKRAVAQELGLALKTVYNKLAQYGQAEVRA